MTARFGHPDTPAVSPRVPLHRRRKRQGRCAVLHQQRGLERLGAVRGWAWSHESLGGGHVNYGLNTNNVVESGVVVLTYTPAGTQEEAAG